MTKKELMTVARELNIKGRSTMNKAALQAAVDSVRDEIAEGECLAQEQEINQPTTTPVVVQPKVTIMTNKHPETCTHNKVFGKAAVAAFAEARVLENVCEARYTYLRRQAVSFWQWLKDNGCDDPTMVCEYIVRGVEATLKEQGPDSLTNKPDDELNGTLWDIHAGMGDITLRMQDEEACYQDYQSELDRIATMSLGKVEAKLAWYDSKLFRLNEELKLHDIIQDALDIIPDMDSISYKHRESWRKYRIKCFNRIDTLRKNKKLSYNGWFLFNNILLEKIGREPKEYQYGDMHLLADTITHYENLKEAARNKIETDKELVRCERLPEENYLALHDEIEAAEAVLVVREE